MEHSVSKGNNQGAKKNGIPAALKRGQNTKTVNDKFTPGGFAEEIFSGPPDVAEKSELPLFVKITVKEKHRR